MNESTLEMKAVGPRRERRACWPSDQIIDVTIDQTRGVRRTELRLHFRSATATGAARESAALLEGTPDKQLVDVVTAIRVALGLGSRSAASRRWLDSSAGDAVADDALVGADGTRILGYAPEPQGERLIERTPGSLRVFLPSVTVKQAVRQLNPASAAWFAAWGLMWTAMMSATGARPIWTLAMVVIALSFAIGQMLAPCVCYRRVDVDTRSGLTLSTRTPVGRFERSWPVEDLREVLLVCSPNGSAVVSVHLSSEDRPRVVARFPERAEAEKFAVTLSAALGFSVPPRRVE